MVSANPAYFASVFQEVHTLYASRVCERAILLVTYRGGGGGRKDVQGSERSSEFQ